ncbi:hypothetical protein BC827DRAFT_1213312 [Russula dissimulans]|nr:hypothetical protein BC827DRAFT_1213312 [Russula dissimulans]
MTWCLGIMSMVTLFFVQQRLVSTACNYPLRPSFDSDDTVPITIRCSLVTFPIILSHRDSHSYPSLVHSKRDKVPTHQIMTLHRISIHDSAGVIHREDT